MLASLKISSCLLSSAPTSAPEGLTSTSVESRSLTVQWGTVPCPDQRGPITGYRLRYSSIVDTTGEGSRQHVLTGLTPFTSYSVLVAAVNAGGTGPYSTALTVETLQDSEYENEVRHGGGSMIMAEVLLTVTARVVVAQSVQYNCCVSHKLTMASVALSPSTTKSVLLTNPWSAQCCSLTEPATW